jgi:Tfp pilus assembly protein PilF
MSSTRRILVLTVIMLSLAACASTSKSTGDPNNPNADADNPLYSLTLLRQGSLFLQQGRYEAALERFNESDRIAPGNATTHNMIGLCHLRMGNPELALPSLQKALELVPSFTDARNNRGIAYTALQQYELAEVDYLAVLRDTTYPHRSEVYFNLGMTYFQRGLYPAAEENLVRATEGTPPVFDAFLRLAEIASQTGGHRREPWSTCTGRGISSRSAPRRLWPSADFSSRWAGPARPRKALQDVTRIAPGTAMAEEATDLLGET